MKLPVLFDVFSQWDFFHNVYVQLIGKNIITACNRKNNTFGYLKGITYGYIIEFWEIFIMGKKRELTETELNECAKLKKIFNSKKKALGLTQEVLAERFKISQPAIGHYLNGTNALNLQIAAQFAEALNVSVSEFSSRLAAELERLTQMQPEAQPDPNVTELSRKIHRVPVVSWVQAGNWSEIEILNPEEYDWVLAVSNVSNRAFALRVQGDSMHPEFTEGDVIICDPEAQWNSGSYIVVMQDDHATFKRLIYDGARPMLKALNPVYGVMPLKDDAIVCGVVKEKVKLY